VEDTDWRALVAEERQVNAALRARLLESNTRNRNLVNENKQRGEYANQLLRQVTWLVEELREARTELRTTRKHNKMLLDASRRRMERLFTGSNSSTEEE
jgi:hypothetical protein